MSTIYHFSASELVQYSWYYVLVDGTTSYHFQLGSWPASPSRELSASPFITFRLLGLPEINKERKFLLAGGEISSPTSVNVRGFLSS
jgi:hypothetical protein